MLAGLTCYLLAGVLLAELWVHRTTLKTPGPRAFGYIVTFLLWPLPVIIAIRAAIKTTK